MITLLSILLIIITIGLFFLAHKYRRLTKQVKHLEGQYDALSYVVMKLPGAAEANDNILKELEAAKDLWGFLK